MKPENNTQQGYRDDIFNQENIVGFASKQTMFQTHALYFDSPEGAGVLITSRHPQFSPGRQELDKDQLNFLRQIEGSSYQEFNQNYQRVIGEMFVSDIQEVKEETIVLDAFANLLQTEPLQTPPGNAVAANTGERTEYELDFQSASGDERKRAASAKFDAELNTALKSLFTDYEGVQPLPEITANQPDTSLAEAQSAEVPRKAASNPKVVSSVPDTSKRRDFRKDESTMAVFSESMHKLDDIGRKKGIAKVPVNEIFDTQDVLAKTPSLSHLTNPMNKVKAETLDAAKRERSGGRDKKKGKDKKREFLKRK
ncbi:hypothetical protein [Ascidiimonas sp. W6]|uniref:hypothetical protein n=1 Tax=Ascidiimonas meishanensis TaxID=3128903 RepID=UPI0030EC471C